MRLRHTMLRRLLPFAALGLAACSSGPQLRDYKVSGQAAELKDVPYYAEAGQQGAPAALAMLLGGSGVQAAPAELAPLVYDRQAGDVTTAAVRGALPHFGRVGWVLRSRQLDLDVVQQVQSGHPVLLLLRSGLVLRQWQYAVLIGVDPSSNSFVLRSAGEQRRVLSYAELLAAWKDGGYWAMLALRPGELPEGAGAAEWIAAALQMEQSGRTEAALQAYGAVTQRWPNEAQAWLGMGRTYYALHNLRGATVAYHNAAKLWPNSAAAHNGLAQALVERQCADQAEDEVNLALSLERDPSLRNAYLRTQRQVADYSGPSVVCPLE
ncbi:MAG TPA: PA2778 family cysteine peptidase [Nevskia sp.]|nr:PA2778 family cysteine peptidase [Nevskia sp.]